MADYDCDYVIDNGIFNACSRCGRGIVANPNLGCHETEPGSGIVVCLTPFEEIAATFKEKLAAIVAKKRAALGK